MLRTLTLALGLLALATPNALPGAPAAVAAEVEAPAVVAGEPEPGPAAHAETPNILEPQIPLAFWTLIVFALLLLVLRYFAWGPLSKALHDREHNLRATLDATERARADAERMLAEHHKLMQQANQQAQAILDEARRGAEANAEQVRRAAQQEAESNLDRARREIESARDQALMDIWGRTADLAVTVAGKVLGRDLQDDDHRRLVEAARNELPAAPNGQRPA